MTDARKMNLGILVHPFGVHPAAWLHPQAVMGAEASLSHYTRVARTAERGLFDMLFIADSPGIRRGNIQAFKRWPTYMAQFEPMTLLSALAAVTERLGLAATVSSSFFEPYNLARQFASLDHLSHGRAAWNIVTSTNPSLADNFHAKGFPDHATRYRQAKEFLEVVTGLWDSWEDDAFVRDREAMVYFDPDKLHALGHKGEFYSVHGPLNVPRPPQGHPVVIQSGGSDAGRELAAETSEVVFTAERSFDAAKQLRDDLKSRMAKYGRSPDHIKTLASLTTIIGRTDEEAQEKLEFLQSKIHPDVGREAISLDAGNIDLSKVPIDQPIPDSLFPTDTERGKTYLKSVRDMIGTGSPTLKEVYSNYATSRGGLLFVGTADKAAQMMGDWFSGGGADGFMLNLPSVPAELDIFVDSVVPELQKRNLFRSAYGGSMLRDHLGLPRPRNRYASDAK